MDNPALEVTETAGIAGPGVAGRSYITFEEYLERSSETHVCEWVDGEIIEMPGANFEHQTIGSFLESVLRFYVEESDLGVVMRAPFAMKLEEQRRGREPDILFVRKDRIEHFRKTYLDGPADLAIELISPESITRDRAEKFVEYEAAGVSEYWLIDPERKIAEFYGLADDGQYRLLRTEDGVFRSNVVDGFFLRIDRMWEPFPSANAALRELGQIK